MGWDGSGNVVRNNGTNTGQSTWQDDAAANAKIRSDRHDTHDQDLADAIENTVALDGQTTTTNDNDILRFDSGQLKFVGVSVGENEVIGRKSGDIEGIPIGSGSDEIPTNNDLKSRQVDSVSDLQSGSFPSSLDRIWLSGYYGVGTAGGGPLYRDSSDTSTADNGGTVFVDSDGVRWKRPIPGPNSVLMWGAKGDGSTDDRPRIQAALDWLSEQSFKRLQVPHYDQYYRTTKPIFVPDDAVIDGDGIIRNEAGTFIDGFTVCMGWFHENSWDVAGQPYFPVTEEPVTAGSTQVTLATPSDADSLTVDKPVFIVTRDSGGAVDRSQNPHVRMFRIVSADNSSGVVQFDRIVDKALDAPSGGDIALTQLGADDEGYKTYICDSPTIRGVTLRSGLSTVLSRDACYEHTVRDVHIEKSLILLGGNARVNGTFDNVGGVFTDYVLETAEGSFNEIYRGIYATQDTSVSSQTRNYLVNVNDSATLSGFRISSHLAFPQLVRVSTDGVVENGKIYCAASDELVRCRGGRGFVREVDFYGLGSTFDRLAVEESTDSEITFHDCNAFDLTVDTELLVLRGGNADIQGNRFMVDDASVAVVDLNSGTNNTIKDNHFDITSDLSLTAVDLQQNDIRSNSLKNAKSRVDGSVDTTNGHGAYKGYVSASVPEITKGPDGWSITNPSTGTFIITHNLGLGTDEDVAFIPDAINPGNSAIYEQSSSSTDANNAVVKVFDSAGTLVTANFQFLCIVF